MKIKVIENASNNHYATVTFDQDEQYLNFHVNIPSLHIEEEDFMSLDIRELEEYEMIPSSIEAAKATYSGTINNSIQDLLVDKNLYGTEVSVENEEGLYTELYNAIRSYI